MRAHQVIAILAHAPAHCPKHPGRLAHFPLLVSRRQYATHQDRKPNPAASPAGSGNVYGQTSRSAFEGSETVGPFPLGVGSSGRSQVWKPWKELGVGGKLGRTVKQSANLGIILLGGGLFVVLTLSLTTELFAKNSPSVLYSQAVDLIRSSDALNPHLLPPLTFTHTPHAAAPVRGTTPVSHRLVRHPSSGRDHMLLTFYVHGRGKDEPEPLSWAKDAWEYVLESAKEAGRYAGLVEDDPAGDLKSAIVQKVQSAARNEQTGGSSGRWFGKVFGGLSSLRTSVTQAGQKGLPPPGTYKVGEVHGDYVKNAGGTYQLLSLVIDVPASSASYPGRAVVFWSPEADRESLIGKIGGRGR